jgi:hypothetical protein
MWGIPHHPRIGLTLIESRSCRSLTDRGTVTRKRAELESNAVPYV